jgi:hypothetical protein
VRDKGVRECENEEAREGGRKGGREEGREGGIIFT